MDWLANFRKSTAIYNCRKRHFKQKKKKTRKFLTKNFPKLKYKISSVKKSVYYPYVFCLSLKSVETFSQWRALEDKNNNFPPDLRKTNIMDKWVWLSMPVSLSFFSKGTSFLCPVTTYAPTLTSGTLQNTLRPPHSTLSFYLGSYWRYSKMKSNFKEKSYL